MDEPEMLTPDNDGDLIRLVRSLEADDAALVPAPADLWSRIEAEVSDGPAHASTPDTTREHVADVVDLGSRRRRWLGIGAGLAVAAAAVGALYVAGRDDGGREVANAVLTNEGLAPFPVTPSGSARLVDDGSALVLELAVTDLPDPGKDFVEVWLIDRNVEGMVSLGPLRADGRYEVPAGVDPGIFPVVDVSLEPADGVPTHSGVSIVRGVLSV